MTKVYIATSRQVGHDCISWAKQNMPNGYELAGTIDESEIIISVLYDKLFTRTQLRERTCFNFHPGSLPKYRGAGCCSWALINEESFFGITLHLIDEGIDTGDIITHHEFPIMPEDTAYTLFQKSENIIYSLFKEWFAKLLQGEYVSSGQNRESSSLYQRKDLEKAKDLTRFIKAFYFPDKEAAYYYDRRGKKIYINF
jgi:methionyl-tRNA formyltransferase